MTAKKKPAAQPIPPEKSIRTLSVDGAEALDDLLYYVGGLKNIATCEPDADIQEVTIDRRQLKSIFETISQKALFVLEGVRSFEGGAK